MLHFVAKRLRTPIMSSLLLALFAASSLLLSLSAAYRIHVEKNIQDTVSQFTVIAIANYSAFDSLGGEFIGENNSQAVHYNNRYLALYNLVKRSKNAVLDKRDYLRGTSSRVWPVLASQMDPESFQREEPYVQNHTFVGTCASISYLTKEDALSLYGAGNMNTPPDLFYKAEFAVEGETLTHPAYSGASTVTVINNRYTSSGEAPFAIGQKYIWIGEYRQPGIIENPAYVKAKEQGVFPSAPPTVPHPEGTSWFKPGLNLSMLPQTLYNRSEYYPTPEYKERIYKGNMYQIPCYPDNWHLHYRKPLNGTLEDFWTDNPVWAEWLRTVAEKTCVLYMF